MYTKAHIGRHPIHPMLVSFPVAFYTATLVAFVVHAVGGGPFWFRLAVCANVAGVVTAIAAAVPGFLDWAFAIPSGSPAKATGVAHMLLNLAALGAFALNAFLQLPHWDDARPRVALSILLPLLGVLATLGAGWLGWKLVQTYHVGVDLSEAQQRLEPSAWSAGRADFDRERPGQEQPRHG